MKRFSKILVCALVVVAACGDDDDDGSGVSQSKTLDEVTGAEAKELCEWTVDQRNEISVTTEQACTVAAALATDDESACLVARNACVEADREPVNVDDDAPCADVTSNDVTCDQATVGDYENCVTAFTKQVGDVYRSASCGKAGELNEPSMPDACRSLNEKCPGILEDVGLE